MRWGKGVYRKWLFLHAYIFIGLSKWLSGKGSACQCRTRGFDPWVRNIPWRKKWQPTQVFLPWKSHGQKSLVGYSPWGCKKVRQHWTTLVNLSFSIFFFYNVQKESKLIWGNLCFFHRAKHLEKYIISVICFYSKREFIKLSFLFLKKQLLKNSSLKQL